MSKPIRLAGIVNDSITDGPGLRMTVFTQGCPHHCPGCHNPQTHDFSGGTPTSAEEILAKYAGNPLLQGITLSGGEPFCQAEALLPVCRGVRELQGNVWVYSGYTYEELLSGAVPFGAELLALCDVLVDGRYLENERDLTLLFRGSRNQRVIDLAASRTAGRPVLLEMEEP